MCVCVCVGAKGLNYSERDTGGQGRCVQRRERDWGFLFS